MRCPTLSELPPAPTGKTGWPWTEDSTPLPEEAPKAHSWPRITIVTPSFNQGQFIEETIRSILLQGYPDIEYFVIDGGSTDNTVDIIRKYSSWIDTWVSEPDRGQSAAINRGFRMGSGLYATWINSDDMLHKNALVSQVMGEGLAGGKVVYIGDGLDIDAEGQVLFRHRGRVQSLEDLVRVPSVWRTGGFISQQEVLFPLELVLGVGGLNEENHYSMDYELWGKFFLAGATVRYTGIPFGYFRRHKGQKTQQTIKQLESTLDDATALTAMATSLSAEAKQEILAELQAYRKAYPGALWKKSGRLARIGLPPSIVTPIRNLRDTVEKTLSSLGRPSK
jgi:Glycosyl transferase family 2